MGKRHMQIICFIRVHVCNLLTFDIMNHHHSCHPHLVTWLNLDWYHIFTVKLQHTSQLKLALHRAHANPTGLVLALYRQLIY